MVGVGRDLCGSSRPTLLPKQGRLQQGVEDLVQAGLEYLQRRRLHRLPGQPGPGLRHPPREEVLPPVQLELPLLPFVPVAPCPVAGHPWQESGPILLTPALEIFISISKVPSQPCVLQAANAWGFPAAPRRSVVALSLPCAPLAGHAPGPGAWASSTPGLAGSSAIPVSRLRFNTGPGPAVTCVPFGCVAGDKWLLAGSPGASGGASWPATAQMPSAGKDGAGNCRLPNKARLPSDLQLVPAVGRSSAPTVHGPIVGRVLVWVGIENGRGWK